ncbi:MAG: hypothetical protein IT581_07280 [Verrucomicrobiales bacterium]|nr:hypothetical protein [Verrucomicrobiales bacterium]
MNLMPRLISVVCALGWMLGHTHLHAQGLPARPTLDLSGNWEFRVDAADTGRNDQWFKPGTPFPQTLRVPGAWNAQGIGFPTAEQLRAYEDGVLESQKSLNQTGTLGVQRESERMFHVFPGPAWYRKSVTIPSDWTGLNPWLIFEGVHRSAEVWIDGQPAGAHHSYLTPFRIDLSPFAKPGQSISVTARVDAHRRREVDPLLGCLDTLDFLYVTWGGIHQPVRLEGIAAVHLNDVFVVPRLADSTAELRLSLAGGPGKDMTVKVEISDAEGHRVASEERPVPAAAPEFNLSVTLPSPKLWSPASPHLYTASVRLFTGGNSTDARTVRFGMREFRVDGGRFLLNGQPIFLRGYGDDCIYPDTIAPPIGKEEFRRRLARAREYGFNYVRHHSWTPPDDYLEAADELGMMLQPEFPLAYGWDLPATEEASRAALAAWEGSIRLRRNHPSIVVWCMGNEQYNSFPLAPEMYQAAKRLDPTRPVIDSDGCSPKHKDRATLDFLVIQFGEGHSIGFGDGKYDFPTDITKPVIAHEMGYFVTLPDLSHINRFTQGVRPYWLFQARELAERNGLLDVYPDWLLASYRLQAASLKCNMEAARRSRLSGTSVWLFQDYPNCAEGVVDMFHGQKGVSPEEFRKFNAPTVLLLDTPRRTGWSGETLDLNFAVSRFEDAATDNAVVRWQLAKQQHVVAEGSQTSLAIRSGEVQALPGFQLRLPEVTRAERFNLRAELRDAMGITTNDWNLWVYPRPPSAALNTPLSIAGFDPLRALYPDATVLADGPVPTTTRLLATTRLDEPVHRFLRDGGSVVLLKPDPVFPIEKTNFRLSSWDGGGPSGTQIDRQHPAVESVATDSWCDLDFYPLIQNSKTILLSPLPAKVEPIIRCIDRPTRLAHRAYLFEARVGKGRLLVTGFNFAQALEKQDPAGRYLLDQLIRYAASDRFQPKTTLPIESLVAQHTP